MDVQIKSLKEVCASGMEQRSHYAALKVAQIKLGVEECALGMGQNRRSRCAVAKDVQMEPSKEECAKDMGQRLSYAAVKDTPVKDTLINPDDEECTLGME
jgi:hypothetical protein